MAYTKRRPPDVFGGHNHAVFVLHRQAIHLFGHTKRNRALLGQHKAEALFKIVTTS